MDQQKPNLVERLLGDASFDSQQRMSLAFLLTWAVGSLLGLPVNASLGLSWLPQMVVLAMAIFSFLAWAAFRSRWLSPDWAAMAFAPLALVGIPYFWFSFNGSGGPAIPMTFALLIFAVLASGNTTVTKQLLWVLAFEALLALLLLAELTLPDLFLDVYANDVERITDRGTTMVFAIAFVGTLLVVYSREHHGPPTAQSTTLTELINDAKIAKALQTDGATRLIASRFEQATVLCADFVGFEHFSATHHPATVVAQLDSLLASLDEICRKHGLERTTTKPGHYVAVSGIIKQRWDHAEAAADAALEMLSHITTCKLPLQIRMGLHTGPLVAGIEGTVRFALGEAPDMASALQMHGDANRIQVLRQTGRLLDKAFQMQKAEEISLPNIGTKSRWFVVARRS